MFYVYILYSKTADKFYVGQTSDINLRLDWHNNSFFQSSYTSQAKDWQLFLKIICETREEALFMEKHIKSMKSKIYYQNLVRYPDIIARIKEKFRGSVPIAIGTSPGGGARKGRHYVGLFLFIMFFV